MQLKLVLSPVFAISFALALPAQSVGIATGPLHTNTPFFETRFANWPGTLSRPLWEARRSALRRQILTAAGLYPLTPNRRAPRAEVFGRKSYPGFTVEKVLIETAPNYWLGGNLFRPEGTQVRRRPAILSPHGHWKSGRLEQTETGNVPARAVMLARMGFVVLTYDMVGYNDTKQTPHAFGNPAEQLWNWGPLGLQLANSIRALDFLQTLPGVDPGRIGATGASGGATQVFLLAAVDDRIRWSAPVNMISGIMQGGSPCENAPGLRVDTFNVEIGAMMAPRPMLMVSATGDWTKNTPRQEFPAIQRIYSLFGARNEVETIQIDAPHNYNQRSREAVYAFFARKVLGLTEGPKESDIPVFTDADLASLHGRQLPPGALSYPQVFEQFRDRLPKTASRDRLRAALLAAWPAHVGDSEVSVRVAGGASRPVLAVHPDGIDAALSDPAVRSLIAGGRKVVALELTKPRPIDPGLRYYLTFQRSLPAIQAQEILHALKWMEQHGEHPELLGLGDAAITAAVAAAMAPKPPKLLGSLPQFSGSDDDWLKRFPAPGIQWAGGWKAVQSLTR